MAITRAQAKGVHKDLPPGGVWRTIRGNHVYILNGEIVAGAGVGKTGKPVKLTKKQLAEHFAELQKKDAAATKTKAAEKKSAATKTKAAEKKTAATKTKAAEKKTAATKTKAAEKKTAATKTKAAEKKTASTKTKAAEKKTAATKTKTSEKKRPEKKSPASEANTTRTRRVLDAQKIKPDDPLAASARKFKAKEVMDWYNSLSDADKDRVAKLKNLPESKVRASHIAASKRERLQHLVNAFHYLRAVGGLSAKSSGKERAGVKDVRHKAQEGRKVAYDVGEKVGGARKDLTAVAQRFEATPTAQDLEILEREHPEMAQKLVNKKNLLKPLDWETEYNNGVDVNVAMAKKLIYDRIAAQPAANDPMNRLLYFNAIQNIQRVLEPIKTWDEFQSATRELGNYMRRETPKELKYREFIAQSTAKKLQEDSPSEYDLTEFGAYYDRNKEKWVIPKDAKAKWREKMQRRLMEDLQKLAESKAANMAPMGLPLGEKFHNFFTSFDSWRRTMDTIRSKRLTWEKHFESLGQQKGRTDGGGKGDKLRPGEERSKIPVSEAKRVGGKAVKVSKPEDMVKNYGFRAVEFGNYVNDEDGKHHLQKASEAFSDLADVLGLSPRDASLGGKLAIAFGARGKGRALAHYEAVSKVINVTRDAGAGTLAHEWGHAMDNILHAESTGKPSIGFASDGIGDKGSSEVREAYEDVLNAMMRGNGTREVHYNGKAYHSPYEYKLWAQRDMPFQDAWKRVMSKLSQSFELEDKLAREHGMKISDQRLQKRQQILENHYHALAYAYTQAGRKIEPLRVPTTTSQFKANADALCGGRSGYWNRPHEMFARAFEAYVLDKLRKSGRRNDYLVYGTDHPMAYPQGEEREKINAAFDRLMAAVRKSGAIRKGLRIQMLLELFPDEELRKAVDDIMIDWPESGITERNAYDVDHDTDLSEVIYIPVNRLRMVYQTDEATDWDKVWENIEKMRSGEALKPVEIGYDYDIHDGHHRWLASKELNYTHVPCIVKGKDEAERQEAIARYRELWKSLDDKELTGGRWVTIEHRHVYIKGGKVVAGHLPNGDKMEAHHIKETQEKIDAQSSEDHLERAKKAARKTDDPMEWLHGMRENDKAAYDAVIAYRSKHGVKIQDLHKEFGGGEDMDEYVPDSTKKMDDVNIGEPKFKAHDVTLKRRTDGRTALASAPTGSTIQVHDDLLKHDKTTQRYVIAHEIGHILSNAHPELERHVLDNPEGALGRMNRKYMRFEGVSYTPEESWADAFAFYHVDPEYLKANHPKAYEFVDKMLKKMPHAKSYLEHAWKQMDDMADMKKSIVADPTSDTLSSEESGMFMYRGIGQKELEFILRHGFIQSKGKGNDDDKGNKDTCFTCLYQQAEGYALWNYIEYNEPAAYVIIVPRPPWVYEDEHGELISDRPVPFDFGSVVYIPHPDADRKITNEQASEV